MAKSAHTITIEQEISNIIQVLSDKEERTLSKMAEILLREALIARGEIKKDKLIRSK